MFLARYCKFVNVKKYGPYNSIRQSLGYGRSRRTYYTPAAAAVRASFLGEADMRIIGSAERLLKVEVDALRRLKSCNARRIPASFESCFAEALNANILTSLCNI